MKNQFSSLLKTTLSRGKMNQSNKKIQGIISNNMDMKNYKANTLYNYWPKRDLENTYFSTQTQHRVRRHFNVLCFFLCIIYAKRIYDRKNFFMSFGINNTKKELGKLNEGPVFHSGFSNRCPRKCHPAVRKPGLGMSTFRFLSLFKEWTSKSPWAQISTLPWPV